MLEFRSCRKEERRSAIQLSVKTFKPNMEEQFQLLLGEGNVDHMFVAIEDGNVVSMVNDYNTFVQLGSSRIKVTSIGSVCTEELYKHRGIASQLIQLADHKMKEEQIRIAIISGAGGIYAKYGANEVGDMIGFRVTRNHIQRGMTNTSFRPFQQDDLHKMFEIYQKESIKFERTWNEFQLLFQGQTSPDSYADYPTYLLLEEGDIKAYVIFQRDFGRRTLRVKEFAGNRFLIRQMLTELLITMKKTSATIVMTPSDPLAGMMKQIPSQKTHLHASLKIVDFKGLMNDLNPYLNEKLGEESLEFVFEDFQDHFHIQWRNEVFSISNIFELNRLVFGPNQDLISQVTSRPFQNELKKIFPIPFVWVNNLNYQ